MNKRIINKRYNKNIKKIEKIAVKKLKERYTLYQVKKGARKGDLVILGLEDWKVQLQLFGNKASIIMHPYSLLDSFNEAKAYISMMDIDENLFNLIDDIILHKEYHLGCAWSGHSTSYEEGIKKYDDYLINYKKHSNEVKEIKFHVNNYLKKLAKHKDIEKIFVTYTKGYLSAECFDVFICTKNNIDDKLENFYEELSNVINIKYLNRVKSSNEIKSSLLLPGRGVKYRFIQTKKNNISNKKFNINKIKG